MTMKILFSELKDLFIQNPENSEFPAIARRRIQEHLGDVNDEKLNARAVYLSTLRRKLMALNIVHNDHDQAYAAIVEKYPTSVYPSWNETTLIEKDRIIYSFKKLRKNADEFQRALRSMPYLPKALDGLSLERELAIERKIEIADRNRALAEAPVVEVNGDEFLMKVDLESPRMDILIPSLLLVTGRRTVEIMRTASFENYETNDEKDENVEYKAIFSGQAKSVDSKPYLIPILAPVEKIKLALASVRQAYPLEDKDNNFINATYSKTINKMCKAVFGLGAHELRAVYAHMCQQSFNVGNRKMSVSGYISKTLGHDASTTSVHYQRVNVVNYSGPLKEQPMTVDLLIGRLPSYSKSDKKKKEVVEQVMRENKYFDHLTLSKEFGTAPQTWRKWIVDNQHIVDTYNELVKPEKPKVQRKPREKKTKVVENNVENMEPIVDNEDN